MAASLEQTDKRIDEIMGLLLRGGVILAAAIVFIGGLIYLSRHTIPATNYRVFTSEPPSYTTIHGIIASARSHSGRGLIQFGLLVLIATPIARVIFSILAFIYERDWKYVVFTLIVLTLLLCSLFGLHN